MRRNDRILSPFVTGAPPSLANCSQQAQALLDRPQDHRHLLRRPAKTSALAVTQVDKPEDIRWHRSSSTELGARSRSSARARQPMSAGRIGRVRIGFPPECDGLSTSLTRPRPANSSAMAISIPAISASSAPMAASRSRARRERRGQYPRRLSGGQAGRGARLQHQRGVTGVYIFSMPVTRGRPEVIHVTIEGPQGACRTPMWWRRSASRCPETARARMEDPVRRCSAARRSRQGSAR